MATASLTAGVAQVEITPPPGTHLSGSVGEYRPAEDVLDPLFARVLILDDGARRLCIIALDLCILTRPFTMLLRRAAAERYGIAPEAVMVHATQTHTAPGVGDFMLDEDFPPVPFDWLRGSEAWYTTFVVAHVLDALAQAMAARQPVTLGAGSGIEAAIPIAVAAIFFGRMRATRSTILENVIVQSVGQASGVVAAGAAFVIPALYLNQVTPAWWQIFLAWFIGGALGVVLIIPLRKYFVAERHGELPFPEAT